MVNQFQLIEFKQNINNQHGVVLVVSLVFLIALTAVAAALMQNTTTDMKMSGASEEKVVADQEVVSAIDEYIFQQVTSGSGNNGFAAPVATFQNGAIDIKAALTITNSSGDISAASLDITSNQFMRDLSCPRSKVPSAEGTISCNLLKIRIRRRYGRNGTSTVEANSGIAQPLL